MIVNTSFESKFELAVEIESHVKQPHPVELHKIENKWVAFLPDFGMESVSTGVSPVEALRNLQVTKKNIIVDYLSNALTPPKPYSKAGMHEALFPKNLSTLSVSEN
jgi:predicted RNase H-like HicB family nuclease